MEWVKFKLNIECFFDTAVYRAMVLSAGVVHAAAACPAVWSVNRQPLFVLLSQPEFSGTLLECMFC